MFLGTMLMYGGWKLPSLRGKLGLVKHKKRLKDIEKRKELWKCEANECGIVQRSVHDVIHGQ